MYFSVGFPANLADVFRCFPKLIQFNLITSIGSFMMNSKVC